MFLCNLAVIIVLIAITNRHTVAGSFHKIPKPKWNETIDSKNHCGVNNSYGFDMNALARHSTDSKCGTDIAVYINRCCYDHDQCYGKALKREFCDANFCECMNQYSPPKSSCRTVTDVFCVLVKDFGAKYWGKKLVKLIDRNF
uniref:Phospholipase A(2) n=1 Tax=Panagrellus redivivus TaxID=6233 RepID=A0A7E4W0Z0_PANRE